MAGSVCVQIRMPRVTTMVLLIKGFRKEAFTALDLQFEGSGQAVQRRSFSRQASYSWLYLTYHVPMSKETFSYIAASIYSLNATP